MLELRSNRYFRVFEKREADLTEVYCLFHAHCAAIQDGDSDVMPRERLTRVFSDVGDGLVCGRCATTDAPTVTMFDRTHLDTVNRVLVRGAGAAEAQSVATGIGHVIAIPVQS